MIIYNARVITWEEENRVLENHAVVIQGKLIKDLGPSDEMLKKYPDEEKIDAGGKILMPGQICSHTHFYGAYSRGLGNNLKPAKDFPEILGTGRHLQGRVRGYVLHPVRKLLDAHAAD